MITQAAKLDMIITKVIEATKRADALEARMDASHHVANPTAAQAWGREMWAKGMREDEVRAAVAAESDHPGVMNAVLHGWRKAKELKEKELAARKW